jgi:hypothetical protein
MEGMASVGGADGGLGGVVDGSGGVVPSSLSPSLIRNGIIPTNKFKSLSIKDKETGKTITFPLSADSRRTYQFKKASKALEDLAEQEGLTIYFLTFTLSSESADTITTELSRILDTVKHTFTRAELPFYYLWVVELQKRRYLKTGVKALHWHLAVAVPDGALPDVKYVADARQHYQVREQGTLVTSTELFKRWGRGQVLCTKAWTGVFGYLGKYLSKEFGEVDMGVARRWGSSRFGVLVYPQWARQEMAALEERGADLSGYHKVRMPGLVSFYQPMITVSYDLLGYDSRGAPMTTIRSDLGIPEIVDDGVLHYYKRVLLLRSPWKSI